MSVGLFYKVIQLSYIFVGMTHLIRRLPHLFRVTPNKIISRIGPIRPAPHKNSRTTKLALILFDKASLVVLLYTYSNTKTEQDFVSSVILSTTFRLNGISDLH